MSEKLISIVTPCFNEEGNVDELYERIKAVMSVLNYQYEHIFIAKYLCRSLIIY